MEVKTLTTSKALPGYDQSPLAKGELNDCVVRAMAVAFDISYEKAHRICKLDYNRQDRDGVRGFALKLSIWDAGIYLDKRIKFLGDKPTGRESYPRMFTYYRNWDPHRQAYKIDVRCMTVGTFLKKYPKGTYLMVVTNHAFVIKDGVVIGNEDDGQMMRRRINTATLIEAQA